MRLRVATAGDLPLLQQWTQQPHLIASNPNDPSDWGLEVATCSSWRELLIAELQGRPVGVMQIIDPAEEESHYWGTVAANLRAIDIWVGAERDLGRGYGTRMMRLALAHCFSDPGVGAVLVDPLANNRRAQGFFERLGFRRLESHRFGEDDCIVYRLDRAGFEESGRT